MSALIRKARNLVVINFFYYGCGCILYSIFNYKNQFRDLSSYIYTNLH